MRARIRLGDGTLIAALSAAFAVLLVVTLTEGLRTGMGRVPVVVSSAESPETYPSVREVRAETPSALLPGDELQRVAGEDLRGRSALYFYDRAHRAARSSGFVEVHGQRGPASFEAALTLEPRRSWWMGTIFAVTLFGSALAIWLMAPGWHLARRYGLACWCFAVMAMRAGATPVSSFDGWLFLVVQPLGAGLTVWNAAEITLSARPVPRLLHALALAAFALGVAVLLALILLPIGPGAAVALRVAFALCFVGGTLGGLTRAYVRSSPIERRQLRWVLLGFYIATTSFLIAFVLQVPSAASIASAAGLAVPISITVAVLGYRFLDVDPLISAVISYSVVGAAVLGGALALVPAAATKTSEALGLEPAASQWLLTVGLLGAAVPIHRALRPRIDQRLFTARHARSLGFDHLLDEIGRCTSVEELTRLLGERLDTLLAPESIVTYARDGPVFAPIFVRGVHAAAAFAANSSLVRTLESRFRPLSADAPAMEPLERAALDALGVALVSPIRRGGALISYTCLGRKQSGDIYTPEEVAYLTAVANRCSEVLVKLDDAELLEQARMLQRSLRRYVPGAVAEEIAGGRELPTEERDVTVLFVDLRGYTSLAEKTAMAEIFSTLNTYTTTVSQLVRERGGTIVEFHGDGLMAVFGAPSTLDCKERAAVEAARDVVCALAGRLAVGIGIASGPAFVGNLRAADRLIWSAIGNTTNLAARLQALTRELGAVIAIDAATEERARTLCVDFESHPGVQIRGRSERADVFALPLARVPARPPS